MNKKIIYVARFVPHYHVSLFETLEEEVQKNGDEFYLISVKNPPNEGRSGITGKVVQNHLFYDKDIETHIGVFQLYWQSGVLEILHKIQPDQIIMPGHVGNITSWIIARKFRNKVFTWQCGYEYHTSKIKDILQKMYLHGFVHHLAYHTEAKRFMMKYGIKEEDITVLHNTINQKELKTALMEEARAFLKNNYDIAFEKNIFLYVGTLLEEKKVDVLINMMNFLDDSYILIVVGDGPYRSKLEDISGDKVVFTGNQLDEKHYFFTAADIFFMPGTGGLALNEAMFYGNVLLSSLGDGSAEDLVVEDFNGKRIDNLTARELAFLVEDLYRADQIKELKKNAKSMTDAFSFESFTGKFIQTLSRIG